MKPRTCSRRSFAVAPPCNRFGRGAVAQLGERLNGIQEVDGSTPFSSTVSRRGGCSPSARPRFGDDMPDIARLLVNVATLLLLMGFTPACSGISSSASAPAYRPDSIERPATSLGDEDGAADKIGKALVAGRVVRVARAAIILPSVLLV